MNKHIRYLALLINGGSCLFTLAGSIHLNSFTLFVFSVISFLTFLLYLSRKVN